MDNFEMSEYRRARLADLLREKFSDNKAALGKALGYTSGAFIRQMIDGERPITEKTVTKVLELPGCARWFEMTEDAAVAEAAAMTVSLERAIGVLAAALDSLDDQQRERTAAAMVTLARAPDSQRARSALLASLRGEPHAAAPAPAPLSAYALDLAKTLDAMPESERGRAHAAASVALSIRQAEAEARSDAKPRPAPPPVKRPGQASRKSR